jgi:hypothetical protein
MIERVKFATVSLVALAFARRACSTKTVWFKQATSSPGHVKKAVADRVTIEVVESERS